MKKSDESSEPLLSNSNVVAESVVIQIPHEAKQHKKIMNVYVDPIFDKEPFPLAYEETKHKYGEQFSQEYAKINESVKAIATKLLYHWKNVPVVFPESISDKSISVTDLFILPTVNELDALSRDNQGNLKKLNSDQLKQVRKNGKFNVPSANFPGKVHTWTLARWLQRGYEKSNKQFFKDLSKALYLIIITAKNRFIHRKFSVYGGLRTWYHRGFELLDILIGMPQKYVDYMQISYELSDRLETYLISELQVEDSDKEAYEPAKDLILSSFKKFLERTRKATDDPEYLKMPHFFHTPGDVQIDLRLSDVSVVKQLQTELEAILTNGPERKLQLNKLRQQLIAEYRQSNFDKEKIKSLTSQKLEDELLRLVCQDVLSSSSLEKIASGIGKTICESMRAKTIMGAERTGYDRELENHMDLFEADLKAKHKVKAQVSKWLEETKKREREKFSEANRFVLHERTVKKLKEQNLYQTAYFVERELQFYKEEQAKIVTEQLKIKLPRRNFTFYRYIWNPKDYIVTKHEQVTLNNEKKVSYSMDMYHKYYNDTNMPFWRWKNFFLRTWIYLFNALFIFGLLIPFNTSLSYRALFSVKPFYVARCVNQLTGEIELDKSKKPKLTLIHRLHAIWKHIRKARAKFEETPDKGLLGKAATRPFNVIWNYFFKGFIGTFVLLLVFPLLCLVISTLSLALAILVPIWYPFFSILHHLAFALIYDWDMAKGEKVHCCRRWIPLPLIFIRLLVVGIISPILAIFTALVLCPIGSLTIIIFALIRKFNRSWYDNLMFYAFVKPLARIPANNSFAAKRTAGPGLIADYVYQIRPEQALAAVFIYIEKEILKSYMDFIFHKLDQPLDVYKNIFGDLMGNYSYTLSASQGPYEKLCMEITDHRNKYNGAFNERLKNLGIDKVRLNDVRLTEKNLDIVIHEAKRAIQFYYESAILKYKNKTADDLFKEANLNGQEWTEYTGFVLEKIFGHGILTPLEDSHDFFNLEVDHLDLGKYADMIATSNWRDDLDDVQANYKPESSIVAVKLPEIMFNNRLSQPWNNDYRVHFKPKMTHWSSKKKLGKIDSRAYSEDMNPPFQFVCYD